MASAVDLLANGWSSFVHENRRERIDRMARGAFQA